MIQGMQQTPAVRQSQVLAPQMRQGLDMLQMTSLELRAELQHQMETNPVIEDVEGKTERQLSTTLPDEHASGTVSERELDFTPTGEAAQQTLSCDDADRDYYLQNMENFHASTENGAVDPDAQSRRQALFDRQIKPETLQEHLQKQIAVSNIPESNQKLAKLLIEYIDEDGYFRGSLPDIIMVSHASEKQILNTLAAISSFDPLGCGGRNLRECLLYQMEKLEDSPWEDEVRALIDHYLPDAAAHREAFICEKLGIQPSEYKNVLSEVRKLDPKPGRGFTSQSDAALYVRPEVFVSRAKSGKWVARVTDRDIPEIRISKKYLALLNDPNCPADTKSYIRERIRAAEALIISIDDRQDTIQKIAQAIVDAQPDVFEKKSLTFLKPLTMEQIAQKTGVHNATVSRTVRDKYMSTPLGVVDMRRFFTAGLTTASGETVSNVAVKNRIRLLIEAEDKKNPLSDENLAKALTADGIKCARRTVAKYRESLNIPGAANRRIK